MKKSLLGFFLVITVLFVIPFYSHAGKTSTYISVHYKAGFGHGGGHYRASSAHGYRRGYHWPRRHHYRGYHHRRPRYYFRGSLVIPWYPFGHYASPPPVIIQKEPQVYIQPQLKEENYWYYCPDPQGYYPYIRNCEGGWMKVVPDASPPNP